MSSYQEWLDGTKPIEITIREQIREAEKEFYKLLDGEVSHHYANKLVKVAFRKAFKELLK